MKTRITCLWLVLVLAACNLSAGSESEILLTDSPMASGELIEASATPQPPVAPSVTPAIDHSQSEVQAAASHSDTTVSTQACTPRAEWLQYTVVAGDTLSRIATRVGSSSAELSQANCLADANLLTVGQRLYVPRLPLSTVSSTSNTNATGGRCLIYIASRTEVVDTPQGTGRTIVGYLEANTTVEPVIDFGISNYYGIMFNGAIAAVRAVPSGDCSQLAYDSQNSASFTCYVESQQTPAVYAAPGTNYTVVTTLAAGRRYKVTALSGGGWYQVEYLSGATGWAQVQPGGDCSGVQEIYYCVFVADTVAPIYRLPEINSEPLSTLQSGDRYRFGQFSGQWQSGDVQGYWIEVFYQLQPPVAGYIQNTGGHLEGLCPES